MLGSLNPAGTTIGRDIDRKSITGECLLMFATMDSHGCSCWHLALASISITTRSPDTTASGGHKMPAPVLMSGAGRLLVNLLGPISGTICSSTLPLLIPVIDLAARLKQPTGTQSTNLPALSIRVTAVRQAVAIRVLLVCRNKIITSKQIAHYAAKRSTSASSITRTSTGVHYLRPATGISARFNTTPPSRPKHCGRNGHIVILEHDTKCGHRNVRRVFFASARNTAALPTPVLSLNLVQRLGGQSPGRLSTKTSGTMRVSSPPSRRDTLATSAVRHRCCLSSTGRRSATTRIRRDAN